MRFRITIGKSKKWLQKSQFEIKLIFKLNFSEYNLEKKHTEPTMGSDGLRKLGKY